MGNWRTVRVIGACDESDLPALRDHVNAYARYTAIPYDRRDSNACPPFHPLVNAGPSVFGIGDWTGRRINAHGNLAERDYDPEDIAAALRDMAVIAPTLALKVHCGGDYEDTACVATVTLANGTVLIGPPEVADVGEFSPADTERRVKAVLGRG